MQKSTLSIFQGNVVFIQEVPWYFTPLFDCHLGQELEKCKMLGMVMSKNNPFFMFLEKIQWRYPGELEISSAAIWF